MVGATPFGRVGGGHPPHIIRMWDWALIQIPEGDGNEAPIPIPSVDGNGSPIRIPEGLPIGIPEGVWQRGG